VLSVVYTPAPQWCEAVSPCALNLHFLVSEDGEHYFLEFWAFFSGERSFMSFAHWNLVTSLPVLEL
jgi:hypothetical protein